MRALVFVLLLVAFSGQVYAAATISEIYAAPSEAVALSGGSAGECQDMAITCDDGEYSSSEDEYSDLGDGSTASASSAVIKNSGNTQATFLRLVYHIDGLLENEYRLRVGHVQNQGEYDGLICNYVDFVSVNTTTCVAFEHEADDQWVEVNVDGLVRDSFSLFDGAIVLRLYSTTSAATVTEVYLKRPFKQSDFQVLPQGVTTGDVATNIENEWIVLSQSTIVLTNASCVVEDLYGGELDADAIQLTVNITNDNRKIQVAWYANETQVVPGENYEIECTFWSGDTMFEGMEQYVYISGDKSMLQFLSGLVDNVLRILGLISDPVSVQIMTTQAPSGVEDIHAITQVTFGGDLELNASCNMTVSYINGTVLLADQAMDNLGTGLYDFSFANEEGQYNLQTVCEVNDSTDEFENYRDSGFISYNPAFDLSVNKDLLERLLLELEVSGTEYLPGDPGKVFAKVLDANNELENTACAVTIHFPNGDEFVHAAVMEPVFSNTTTVSQSFFQYDFIVPETIGVHPVTVACSLNASQELHPGPPVITVTQGNVQSGADTDLEFIDDVFYVVNEQAKIMDLEFEFSGVNITNLTTALTFHFDAERLFGGAGDPANDTMIFSLFNYTGAVWKQVATPYAYTSGTFPFTFSIGHLEGMSDMVSGGGLAKIRIEDSIGPPGDNAVDTTLSIDRVTFSTITVGGTLPVDLIKSSSEVHVSPPPIESDLSEGRYSAGETAEIANVVYWANAPAFSQYSFINGAQCFLALTYPNGTSWQILEMNDTGTGGIYLQNVTFPGGVYGNYIARSSCQGGDLPKLVRDSSTLIVFRQNTSLIETTLDIANQTLDIANDTLALVQALGGSVSVRPQEIQAFTAETLTVMSALLVGLAPEDAATCTLKVYYPNATVWLNDQNMTSIGADGLYKTSVEFEEVTGNYQVISTCSGGALVTPVTGFASWHVSDGVTMSSIT